ncbi:hypothetical protein RCL1_008629 [Eukaryota sp. TZLM3-RCL]
MSVLSAAEVEVLKTYKHCASDKSILSNHVLIPIWHVIQKRLPSWVSPNAITFTGGLCTILVFLYAMLFNEEVFTRPLTRVSCILIGIAWLAFLACDSLDGIHARATGMCSPLGDCIDHSIDSLVYVYGGISLVCIFVPGNTLLTVLAFISGVGAGYAVEVEYAITKQLSLGLISGPSEGVAGSALIAFTAAIIGPHVFLNSVTLPIIGTQTIGFLVLVPMMLMFWSLILGSIISSVKYVVKNQEGTSRAFSAFTPFFGLILMLISLYLVFPNTYTSVLYICLASGSTVAHFTNKVLIARLCKKSVASQHFVLMFCVFVVPLSLVYFLRLYEFWFVVSWAFVSMLVNLSFMFKMLCDGAKHLKLPLIRTFTPSSKSEESPLVSA